MQIKYVVLVIFFLFFKVYSEETFFLKNSNKFEIDNKVALESHNYNFCFIDNSLFFYNIYPDSNCCITLIHISNGNQIKLQLPDDTFKYKCLRTNVYLATNNRDIAVGYFDNVVLIPIEN